MGSSMINKIKNILKYIKKHFLFVISFLLFAFYISFGLIVRKHLVLGEENKKIVFHMIIFAAIFYLSLVGFYAFSKSIKKASGSWKKFFNISRFIFLPISLFYLLALLKIFSQNIDNIINELIYIKDFIFPHLESLLSKRTSLSQYILKLINVLLVLCLVRVVISFGPVYVKTRVPVLRYYTFRQKATNEKVIESLEIKGFLYKALP